MTAPVYTEVAPRLYSLSSAAQAGIPSYWAGYYSSPNAQFGTSAAVQDVWDDVGGVYLFSQQTPTDFAAFSAALQLALPLLSPQGWLRFLWISNPNATYSDWQTQTLLAVAANNSTPLQWTLIRQQSFTLGSYSIWLQGGGTLTLANTDNTGYGAIITSTALSFNTSSGGYPASGNGLLSFTGALLGALAFPITLNHQQGDDFAHMGVMLRYTMPDVTSQFGETKSLSMPVLANSNATVINTNFYFDPLNPLLAARSGVALYNPGGVNPTLSSAFVTDRGYAITLTPGNGGGALSPARLGFCSSPLLTFSAEMSLSALNDYHLAPDGAYIMHVVLPLVPPLETDTYFMFGTSGIEAAQLGSAGNPILFFQTGNAAYIPYVDTEGGSALQMQGTTAYATVLPAIAGAGGLTYYAQPLQAPLFQSSDKLGSGFMDFHGMPSGLLSGYSSGGATPVVLPVGAYKWLQIADVEFAKQVEEAVLAPRRRALVALPIKATQATLRDEAGANLSLAATIANPYLAVTPQGLIAKLTTDMQSWAGITLANMPTSQHKEVELTAVGDQLQAALQANQLFFVVSNVGTFMTQSSVRYQLTHLSMELLAAQGVPAAVITALERAYGISGTAASPIYETETAFLAVYPTTPPECLAAKPKVLAVAGLMETDIEGWTFQLSPRSWRHGKDAPTMMLFKFCNRSLVELVNDGNAWNWPQAAWDKTQGGSIAATQTQLKTILDEAAKHTLIPNDPLGIFYRDTANNPLWNGVLFFNAPVDFTEMPPELQFLSAGIDTSQFYAHHIGFSVTPFEPVTGGIDLKQTAAFGLIDYEDEADLVADSSIQFGFKTMQLKVRFANAQVVDFAAQVELMVNDLLGSPLSKVDPTRGNNLIIQGSCQRIGGLPSYNFVLTGQNLYTAQSTVLVSVEVLTVQLLSGGGSTLDNITMQFILMGNLRYVLLADFDLFSYGTDDVTVDAPDSYLRFGSLAITMSFARATPDVQTWSIIENAMSFDTASSLPRTASLANNFPLIINHLIASPNLAAAGEEAKGQTPEDLGYSSISCPLEQTPMVAPWYGLVFNMDLGSLGALADSVGFNVSVLAAWKQGARQGDTELYLGLKLPNIPAVGGSIPLQGILKLGFRSFEFSTYIMDNNTLGYMLTLRRFALSILCWSFPPGNTDIRIFGAPAQPRSSVGWYAAYDSGEADKGQSAQKQRAIASRSAQKSAPMLAIKPSAQGEPTPPPVEASSATLLDTKIQRRLKSGRRTPRAAG